MTTEFFPFDAGAGANVQEAQWRKMARHWIKTGVLVDVDDGDPGGLKISQRAGGAVMGIDVAAGAAWIRGHYFASDAVEQLSIAAADPTDDRIDRIILRTDFVTNEVTLEILEGTPDPAPVAPALEQTAARWEISLAQVAVDAAVSSIGDGDITDERAIVWPPEWGGAVVLDANGDDVEIVNTAVLTALYTIDVPPEYLREPGSAVRLVMGGTYENDSAASRTLRLDLFRAGVAFYDDTSAAIAASAVLAPWRLELTLTRRSAADALTFAGHMYLGNRGAAQGQGDLAAVPLINAPISQVSVGPTANVFPLLVRFQHSVASVNLSILRTYARLELLPVAVS